MLNVWIAPADAPAEARAVTRDTLRGIRSFSFSHARDHLTYLQDEGGDENFHLFSVNIETGEERNLTPFPGARARPAGRSHKHPDEMLVMSNNRDPQYFDLHRVNVRTGEIKLVRENNEFTSFVTDSDFEVRYARRPTPDGGAVYLRETDEGWVEEIKVDPVDVVATSLLGFTQDGKTLYLIDSRGRDTGALLALDVESGESKLVHEDPRADIGEILTEPATGEVLAVSAEYRQNRWHFVDKATEADYARLKELGDGEISVVFPNHGQPPLGDRPHIVGGFPKVLFV